MNIDVTTIIVQLLNISIQFEKLEIPHNMRLIIGNKLDILRSIAIEAMNLLRLIKEDKKSQIHVSIKIAEYYKKFQLRNYHQTYHLTKEYQRKLVFVPLINHYIFCIYMKRRCLEFYCKKLYMHTHCYFSYDNKMYFQIHDLQRIFDNAIHILLISNLFQRRYSYKLKYSLKEIHF